jgi:hypothetical protein
MKDKSNQMKIYITYAHVCISLVCVHVSVWFRQRSSNEVSIVLYERECAQRLTIAGSQEGIHCANSTTNSSSAQWRRYYAGLRNATDQQHDNTHTVHSCARMFVYSAIRK